MARMRRTAANEAVPPPPVEGRPEVVVHNPEPRQASEQRWTLTSYPFYEPPPASEEATP